MGRPFNSAFPYLAHKIMNGLDGIKSVVVLQFLLCVGIFQGIQADEDDHLLRFAKSDHLLRFARAPMSFHDKRGEEHLLRFAKRGPSDHLLRYAKGDDHLLRFARGGSDHLLRFAKGGNDHLLRFARGPMSFNKRDSSDSSDYIEDNADNTAEEISSYPQYDKRFSYLLRGSRAQTDDHMLRFARSPAFQFA